MLKIVDLIVSVILFGTVLLQSLKAAPIDDKQNTEISELKSSMEQLKKEIQKVSHKTSKSDDSEPSSDVDTEVSKLNNQILNLQKKVKAGLSTSKVQDELLKLRSRINQLKEQKNKRDSSSWGKWAQGLDLSGVIDIDAFSGTDKNRRDTADIQVASLEMSLQKNFSKSVNAQVTFLYEEDSTNFGVDQAFFTSRWGEEHMLSVSLGRKSALLGVNESKFISDTLVYSLTDFIDGMLQIQYDWKNISLGTFIMNGQSKVTSEADGIKTLGVYAEYSNSEKPLLKIIERLHVAYLNNAGDIDGISGHFKDIDSSIDNNQELTHNPSIWDAQIKLSLANFSFIGEYATLTKEFDRINLSFHDDAAKIKAWQYELAYHFAQKYSVQAGFQGSSDALSLELPQKRYIAGLTWEVNDYMNINVEHRIDQDYSTDDGGTGNADRITTVEWEAVFF